MKCKWCEGPVGGEEKYHLILVNVETNEAKTYCSSDCLITDLKEGGE